MARSAQQTATGGVMPGLISTNGVVLAYDSYGQPGNRAVVLLQGLAEGRLFWPESTIETLLDQGFYVVAVDNRDIGDSTILEAHGSAYTLEDMAADTIGLLDALHIRKADVIGYSLGGMIAQVLALKFPSRVKSLVLTMTTSRDPTLPTGDRDALAVLMKMADATNTTPPRERLAALWRVIAGEFEYARQDETNFVDLLLKTGYRPAAVARQLNAGLTTPPCYDKLGQLALPVTVVHGEADRIFPTAHGEDLARRIPGASLRWLPRGGHVLCRHTASSFNAALLHHFCSK